MPRATTQLRALLMLLSGVLTTVPAALAREPSTRPDLLDTDRPTLRVSTARQLLENLGPDRVIELAPGVYDLSSATDVSGPHLSWEKTFNGLAPVVHDVEGLTLRGVATGEARIEVGPRYAYVLTLRRVRDVVLDRLVLGHEDLPAPCNAGVLRIEVASDVAVRRTVLSGSGTEGLTLRAVRNSRFEDLTIRDTTESWATLVGSDGVVFERCRWFWPALSPTARRPLRLVDSWGVDIAYTELVDPEAQGGVWTGRYLEADPSSSVRFRDSRVVDAVTREHRSFSGLVPPSAADSLPAEAYRSPEWELVRGEEEHGSRAVTLVLADGRSVPLPPEPLQPGIGNGGLDPTSVRVRSLAPDGPLLVRWSDLPAGTGGYASGFYRVLGPAPDDPVLLSGEVSLSGRAGALDSTAATFEVGYRDGVLSLREDRTTHSGRTEPAPLHHPETIGDEQYFTATLETVEVRTWRYRATRLEPLAQTLYYRVQEGDTPDAVTAGLRMAGGETIRREWFRKWFGRPLPAPGQWLEIDEPSGDERTDGGTPPELISRRISCARGFGESCAYEATAYDNGWHGLTADPAKAARLRASLCEHGNAPACTDLAWQHVAGRGVPKDPAAAAELYRRACRLGDPDGCNGIGGSYQVGQGVVQDEARALEFSARACELRARDCYEMAQRLGWEDPRNPITPNPHLALRFAERGCDDGHLDSCALAGGWLVAGHGVERDVERGRELLGRPCDHRDDRACMTLGESLETDDRARALAVYDTACHRSYIPACRAADRLNGEPPPMVDDPGFLGVQTVRVHPSLPPFELRLFGDPYGSVCEVEVRAPGAEPVHLPWIHTDADFAGAPPTTTPRVRTMDLNFDGYQDLLSLIWAGATGNGGYAVWIYEPETGRFVANRELWGQNPTPHPEQQRVTTFFKGGMAGAICISVTYRWIDGKAVQVAAVQQDWDEERQVLVRTVYELRDGQIQPVETIDVTDQEIRGLGGC